MCGRSIAEGGLSAGLVGFVPQTDALCDFLTVGEHAKLFARLRGVDGAHVGRVARAACIVVGITPFWDLPANRLSGGTRRKLSLACALAGAPSVLLLDEFTSGVDAVSRRFLWGTISGIRERLPTAVLLSSVSHRPIVCRAYLATALSPLPSQHHMEDLQALCTSLVVMRTGCVLASGPPQALRDRFCAGYSLELHLDQGGCVGGQEMGELATRIEAMLRIHASIARLAISGAATSASEHDADAGTAAEVAAALLIASDVARGLGGSTARAGILRTALSPAGSGWALQAALAAAVRAASAAGATDGLRDAAFAFASWWISENRVDALVERVYAALPRATVMERHSGRFVRISLPPGSYRSVGSVFRLMRGIQTESVALVTATASGDLASESLAMIGSFGLSQNSLDVVLERMMDDTAGLVQE